MITAHQKPLLPRRRTLILIFVAWSACLQSGVQAQSPTITLQPQGQIVAPGSTVVFTAAATGVGTIRYRWRCVAGPVNLNLGTSATLIITNATVPGLYDVAISDDLGGTLSERTPLTFFTMRQVVEGIALDLNSWPPRTTETAPTYELHYVDSWAETNWVVLTNVTVSTNPFQFIDTSVGSEQQRFYRAVLLPGTW